LRPGSWPTAADWPNRKAAHRFIDGFTPALWVAVGPSALGIVAALLAVGRTPPAKDASEEIMTAIRDWNTAERN
jgi:hypothetical protein